MELNNKLDVTSKIPLFFRILFLFLFLPMNWHIKKESGLENMNRFWWVIPQTDLIPLTYLSCYYGRSLKVLFPSGYHFINSLTSFACFNFKMVAWATAEKAGWLSSPYQSQGCWSNVHPSEAHHFSFPTVACTFPFLIISFKSWVSFQVVHS